METHGDNVSAEETCVRWFRRFKRGDFDLKHKERPDRLKTFENPELQSQK